jgi:hypothetical protein
MPILVVGTESNLEGLHGRLFSGKVSGATAKRVAEAMRIANPGVDLDALRPGTVLTVPDLPEVALRGDISLDSGTKDAADAILANAKEMLAALVDTADRLRRDATVERRRVGKAMDGREVQAAAAEDKDLAADLDETRRAMDEEEAAAKERAASLKKAQDSWTKELDAFRARLG